LVAFANQNQSDCGIIRPPAIATFAGVSGMIKMNLLDEINEFLESDYKSIEEIPIYYA